ncbi:MAG: 3-deoxy-7-phosphoheptulonate synthase, partial [Candidatus Pacearchaeota archaeon]
RILNYRKTIKNILEKKDKRKLVICGPCSIHNLEEGIIYAKKLKEISEEVKESLFVIMRTYLEKPRTTVGWKGFLYDPYLDGTNKIIEGIEKGRKFLKEVNEIGLPCAYEFLRTDTPQYLADLISWGAIGARTTESQPHRELASGLSMPIGFKNNTSGDIFSAINSCVAAKYSHSFPGINKYGKLVSVKTLGNPYCHVVLRGGNGIPNYYPEKIKETALLMKKEGLIPNILVDCSHANSNKIYINQTKVAKEVLQQIIDGNNDIIGIMLESNINEGKQDFPKNKEEISNLKYGVSITDACISLEETKKILKEWDYYLRRTTSHS